MGKKEIQLKENFGTAAGKLRKMVFFSIVKKFELNTCYRCGESIDLVGDFTLDHKLPWLDSDDPIKNFYNLDNVTFSHARCNIKDRKCSTVVHSNSGFKGVFFDKRYFKPYFSSLETVVNGVRKVYRLGNFSDAKEAAKAYDVKAIEIFQDQAVTNSSLGLL